MARPTVIVGTSALALKVATELSLRRRRSRRLVGVVSEGPGAIPEGFPCPHLGTISDFEKITAQLAPKRIIVALGEKYDHLPVDRLVDTRARQHIHVERGADAFERLTGRLAIESLMGSTDLFSSDFRPKPFTLASGRLVSIIIAATGLILSFPLMAIVALAIRIDSQGPILFVQERIGFGGKEFRLLKFRSMFHTDRKRSEWEADNVKEITRIGRVIRKFRLDELPQFINVLRGDMNIVGPRPHPLSNRELFELVSRNTPTSGMQIPYYSLRQSVRPGITGWAQVRYKYANGLDEEIEKLGYDLYYIKHYSPFLDIRILLDTVKVVLFPQVKEATSEPHQEEIFEENPGLATSEERPVAHAVPRLSLSNTRGASGGYSRDGDRIHRLHDENADADRAR